MATAKKAAPKVETLVEDAQKTANEAFEKITKSSEDMMAFAQDNYEALVKASEIAAKAAEGLNAEVVAYAKKSVEEGVAAAKELAEIKTIPEFLLWCYPFPPLMAHCEFGCGPGLPSITAADLGSPGVVATIVADLALELVNKKIDEVKVVVNGAGAAGISCAKMYRKFGVKNIVMCDSKGVSSTSRTDLNAYKAAFAIDDCKTPAQLPPAVLPLSSWVF